MPILSKEQINAFKDSQKRWDKIIKWGTSIEGVSQDIDKLIALFKKEYTEPDKLTTESIIPLLKNILLRVENSSVGRIMILEDLKYMIKEMKLDEILIKENQDKETKNQNESNLRDQAYDKANQLLKEIIANDNFFLTETDAGKLCLRISPEINFTNLKNYADKLVQLGININGIEKGKIDHYEIPARIYMDGNVENLISKIVLHLNTLQQITSNENINLK